MTDTLYVITWEDAHGERTETFRRGRAVAEFVTGLFDIGCMLVSVETAGE